MNTRTLLYSRLDALARKAPNPLDEKTRNDAISQCKSILARELDSELMDDVCQYWAGNAKESSDIPTLADILAVLLEPESEPDKPLSIDIYTDLSEILNEHADTMDLDKLAEIMNTILAKGAL
jgi:hypothetical protein